MPKGIERNHQLLAYADEAKKMGDDYEAAKIYGDVMSLISWESTDPEESSMLRHAYNSLYSLSCSQNECAWEIASQYTGDYAAFLRNRCDNNKKT